VLRHPFYAVTGEDGSYEIKGLPAGTYTVAAWHEKFGEKTMQVTVPAKGSASADFTFAEGAASNTLDGGSLKIMPALELPMLGRH
ncbi:MAG TPA: carboxypeptidase-like regulatory domain-containing protein, partial [Pyrinomonadaceae bacterium]|nr:carboxypeptidase-like regulatory domain-containing protein [Pyrinomonadaceae bacterium]